MAGSIEAAAPPGRDFPSFWSSRRCCCRRRRQAMPALPGLLSLGLLLSRVCCGALVGPIVDPHVKAVWGKNVTLKCIIDIPVNETLTQISWEKIHGKSAQAFAVRHPEYGFSVHGEYQGRVLLKNTSLIDSSIILINVTFSDSGEYVCKAATFPLGSYQSSTNVAVFVEPIVSLTKGPNALIDGANQTVAAICTAATGKPAAEIDWEPCRGCLGEMESTSTSYPNETVTVESQYKLVPTKFARGRHITCIVKHPALKKELRMLYMLDIQYSPEVTVTGYDGNWYIGRKNVLLRCNADANPLPMKYTWSRLDGHWPQGLEPANNTLHFSSPLNHNYTGTYVCKVANLLGQRSDQKTVYILDPPTTTTSPFTVPWFTSTDVTPRLATQPQLKFFTTSSWRTVEEDNWGTIVGSAVGGALFLILICILVGAVWYRRRRTFRGDYFAKNYIPPTDMQRDSQIDTLQVEDVASYPDSVKKEVKHPVNSLITKDYLGETEKTEWNKVDTINRYQDRYERPMDYYESGTLGMKYLGDECYDENEDDLVSHVDGSVISRKEWYV